MKTLRLIFLFSLFVLTAPLLAQKAKTVVYGSYCNGGLFQITELPKLGTTLTFMVLNNDAKTGVIGIGLRRAKIFMGVTNGDNCYLFIYPLWLIPFTSGFGNGTGTLFKIPNNRALIGFKFNVQAVSRDSNGLGWTVGIEATIGT